MNPIESPVVSCQRPELAEAYVACLIPGASFPRGNSGRPRFYSGLDRELLSELIADERWSKEGLFALLQGIRRLGELGGKRVNLPAGE
jgi:hypothetical protein